MTALEEALGYHERGFALIPLAPGSKGPHAGVLQQVHGTRSWSGLRERRASPADIEAWYAREPNLNLGIVTGAAFDGLSVIDLDKPSAARQVRHPPSPCVKTHRGHHVYVRSSRVETTQFFDWGEIRGGGDYVVAPPSIHPSGVAYEWVVGLGDAPLADLAAVVFPARKGPREDKTVENLRQVGLPVEGLGEIGGVADDLARDEAAVRRVARKWGIDVPLGRKFRCVLPGHTDNNPSASIWRGSDGVFVYRDFHSGKYDTPGSMSLAHVLAARVNGGFIEIGSPSLKRWYMRLFFEAGCFEAGAVQMPPVVDELDPMTRSVAEGFRLLVRLRWADDPGEPVPYTAAFASNWCGVSTAAAEEAIYELRRLRVLRKVGVFELKPQALNLYVPGPGPSSRQRVARRS